MDTTSWTELMERVVREAAESANYAPGTVLPPGSGTEGDDPNGLRYADLGPLAFVLCEALDGAVTRGIDRGALIDVIAQGAEGASAADVEDVLSGDALCPPSDLLGSFAEQLAIDLGIIMDAAQRGGCKQYSMGPNTTPGY